MAITDIKIDLLTEINEPTLLTATELTTDGLAFEMARNMKTVIIVNATTAGTVIIGGGDLSSFRKDDVTLTVAAGLNLLPLDSSYFLSGGKVTIKKGTVAGELSVARMPG